MLVQQQHRMPEALEVIRSVLVLEDQTQDMEVRRELLRMRLLRIRKEQALHMEVPEEELRVLQVLAKEEPVEEVFVEEPVEEPVEGLLQLHQ